MEESCAASSRDEAENPRPHFVFAVCFSSIANRALRSFWTASKIHRLLPYHRLPATPLGLAVAHISTFLKIGCPMSRL